MVCGFFAYALYLLRIERRHWRQPLQRPCLLATKTRGLHMVCSIERKLLIVVRELAVEVRRCGDLNPSVAETNLAMAQQSWQSHKTTCRDCLGPRSFHITRDM